MEVVSCTLYIEHWDSSLPTKEKPVKVAIIDSSTSAEYLNWYLNLRPILKPPHYLLLLFFILEPLLDGMILSIFSDR